MNWINTCKTIFVATGLITYLAHATDIQLDDEQLSVQQQSLTQQTVNGTWPTAAEHHHGAQADASSTSPKVSDRAANEWLQLDQLFADHS
ncbi:hypothetical protein IC617_10930 [Neiella sp. HB171785]|uniref:Secreted protein n=1 Tax=Neiella litorisoli TaxID=2771431 RepID=A0A8J6UQ08_9GAMM|nr:hypothetical protein [Neiella litorisoli]MBD1389942.1 hypothetical protein [Neiella litorisoli]